MRGTLIFIALLCTTPVALAQDPEPTVNDSDYDTTPPADDQTYLDDAQMESDAMQDGEFDTSLPGDDTRYLDEAEAEISGSDAGSGAGRSGTPGVAIVVLLGLVAALALAWPRR